MKYLRINKGNAEFLEDREGNKYLSITEMINTNVFNMLMWIGEDETPEFDEDISKVKNDAERVIYDNLLIKFKDFIKRKDEIKSEIDKQFQPLEEKYLAKGKSKRKH